MNEMLAITRALSDESRVRALWMLHGGELCVCQIIDALKLAPATVSRHMSLLYAAGLVVRRKEGKWAYYRWPGQAASPAVRSALKWVASCLEGDAAVAPDEAAACRVRSKDPQASCVCYRS